MLEDHYWCCDSLSLCQILWFLVSSVTKSTWQTATWASPHILWTFVFKAAASAGLEAPKKQQVTDGVRYEKTTTSSRRAAIRTWTSHYCCAQSQRSTREHEALKKHAQRWLSNSPLLHQTPSEKEERPTKSSKSLHPKHVASLEMHFPSFAAESEKESLQYFRRAVIQAAHIEKTSIYLKGGARPYS